MDLMDQTTIDSLLSTTNIQPLKDNNRNYSGPAHFIDMNMVNVLYPPPLVTPLWVTALRNVLTSRFIALKRRFLHEKIIRY